MAALESLDVLGDVSSGLTGQTPTGKLADAELGPPVPRPRNCFGIGLNYRKHAEESNMALPEAPLVFTKFPSCITGPNADIELRSDYVDYEGELVVAIGPGGKDITEGDAWNHVAGLCIGQDISDRPAQFSAAPPHFDLGKSFDTFGPIGPVLVSTDQVSAGADLDLVTEVNGEVRQKDNTGDLIFSVPQLVSYLSHITTLLPGDLIFTGTPSGVGVFDGRLLKDGDVVTTRIAELGQLTNRCVRVSDHPRADFVPPQLKAILDKK